MPSFIAPRQPADGWLVACLCAEWCGTCRDYRAPFEALAREAPATAFAWIDIEDDSDWAGDLDVENFPTVLIAHHGEPRFFGTVLPHAAQLARLLASLQAGDTRPGEMPAEAGDLARRLWAGATVPAA